MTPEDPSLALVSWKGGFALGQVTKVTPLRLSLELRCQPGEGRRGPRWSLRYWRILVEPETERQLLWELDMPVRTEAAAMKLFVEIKNGLRYARTPTSRSPAGATAWPDLTASQLRFLAKSHPDTVRRWKELATAPDDATRTRLEEELREAFCEETFARSKVLLDPVADGDRVLRMARLFARMAARKRTPDPVEYELIVGCCTKGYWRMTWAELQKAVAQAVGYRPTVDALRKKWKRMALPSRRRCGRPRRRAEA